MRILLLADLHYREDWYHWLAAQKADPLHDRRRSAGRIQAWRAPAADAQSLGVVRKIPGKSCGLQREPRRERTGRII